MKAQAVIAETQKTDKEKTPKEGVIDKKKKQTLTLIKIPARKSA
jgi:hypothetical protein